MYAIVYDVAGNYQRSWTASINLSDITDISYFEE